MINNFWKELSYLQKKRSYNSEVHWITAVKTDRWPTLKHILLNHSSAIIF